MTRVAVLMGGLSGEREVSLRSGAAVSRALRELGHEILEIDVGDDVVEVVAGLRGKADAAFVALHGRLGEDGTVQGLLELVGIPYTGSGVLASAVSMSKSMTKGILRAEAVPVADDAVVSSREVASLGMERICEGLALDLGFPLMVKPDCEGSSLGASKVRDREELAEGIACALEYDDVLVVERYIEGREMTVGLMGEEPVALPVLEVVASKGVYDYECKYTKGKTEYLVPAPIPAPLAAELQRLALRAFKALGCEGVSRVDFMVDEEGRPFCLEINTIPGMTELSLIPKAAAAAGYSFEEVVETILRTARLKTGRGKRCHEG